jgi:hypothetical protein
VLAVVYLDRGLIEERDQGGSDFDSDSYFSDTGVGIWVGKNMLIGIQILFSDAFMVCSVHRF